MMKFIKTIFSDITKGKNIGMYFTILIALLLPVLNFLKVYQIQDEKLFLSIILAVLGFILAKLVEKNWLIEKLEQSHNKNETILQEIKSSYQHFPCNVLPTWHAPVLMDNLRSIRQNIVLVQSWFPDASVIADAILHAVKKNNATISVDIYMLDPKLPFGAQRWCEVNDRISEFDEANLTELKAQYEQRFNSAVIDFTNRFNINKNNINYRIHVYPSMPTLKVYCIDDNDYYFGWLGLDSGSTNNVCFHVSNNSNYPESNLVSEKIKNHLDRLKQVSRTIKASQ